jgi:hypothetical protein
VHALTAWGPERTLEAEAICRLLPIGFPYQYAGLPLSARKVAFLAGFLTRFLLFKLLERLRNATGSHSSSIDATACCGTSTARHASGPALWQRNACCTRQQSSQP